MLILDVFFHILLFIKGTFFLKSGFFPDGALGSELFGEMRKPLPSKNVPNPI